MKEKKQALRTVLFIITFTVFLIYLVNHVSVIVYVFNRIMSLLLPFLLGCGIAFIINIPMRSIENTFFKKKEGKLYRYKRAISMVASYILIVGVVLIVLFVIVPEVGDTIETIKYKLPDAWENAKAWAVKYTEKYPEITEKITSIEIKWDEVGNLFKNNGETIITTTFSIFSSIISAIVNVFVGIVFSIYILSQKEKLAKQIKMVLYALLKESTADEVMVFGKIANTTFSKFFTCQFREGIILGSMIAIAMKILGMPYPLTIGVLIAFTALIPIFGAFFGLAIGIFLILVDSPKYVIWFIIVFFVLQFIENYLIYPKLVGGDIGLSAIWVLLAVLVGGDLMGVAGMLIFIPLVSVLYAYTRSLIYRKLKNKGIDVDKKEVPDDVMPLMSGRRRLFQPKNKQENDSCDEELEEDFEEADCKEDKADEELTKADEAKVSNSKENISKEQPQKKQAARRNKQSKKK